MLHCNAYEKYKNVHSRCIWPIAHLHRTRRKSLSLTQIYTVKGTKMYHQAFSLKIPGGPKITSAALSSRAIDEPRAVDLRFYAVHIFCSIPV